MEPMQDSQDYSFSRVRVDSAGRVVIPFQIRKLLGIEPGHELILLKDALGIRLQTFEQVVREAQQAFAPFRVDGQGVVDALIQDREEDARRDANV